MIEAWDEYWANGAQDDVAVRDKALHRRLTDFWEEQAQPLFASRGEPLIADLACGSGMISKALVSKAKRDDHGLDLIALDRSPAAIDHLASELGSQISTVVADGCEVPFGSDSFDGVFSQFGLEYAGRKAVENAPKLLANGGRFVAICHSSESAIFQECRKNLVVLDAALSHQMIEKGREFFDIRSSGRMGRYDEANTAYESAVIAVRDVALANVGAAAEYVSRVSMDIGTLLERYEGFVLEEAFSWFDGQLDRMQSYQMRMKSMTESALDEASIDTLADRWSEAGLEVVKTERFLEDGTNKVIGWVLEVHAPSA